MESMLWIVSNHYMLCAFVSEIVWWLLARVKGTYSYDRAQKRASRTAKLVTGLIFRRSVVESQPGIGGRNEIRDDWFWIVHQSIFLSSIFLFFLAYRFLSIFSLFLHVHFRLLSPTHAPSCHPFRRFCPPPRETINFLDLNPGLCATATTTTTTAIDRFRFYGAYMYVPHAERGNAACTGFMRPCLPVWRHIYEGSGPSIQSRYSVQLSLSLSTYTSHVYFASSLRGETYQTLSPLPPFVFLRTSPFLLLISWSYLSRRFIRASYADVASE